MTSLRHRLEEASTLAYRAREYAEQGHYAASAAFAQSAAAFAHIAGVQVALGQVLLDEFPEPPPPMPLEVPEWCGKCDGPELGMRWVQVDGTNSVVHCPRCTPRHPLSAVPVAV